MYRTTEDLLGSIQINPSKRHYPSGIDGCPSTHNLQRHYEIYQLIKEFTELEQDYKNCSPSAKSMIGERMDVIRDKLFEYWIVLDGEMELPKEDTK